MKPSPALLNRAVVKMQIALGAGGVNPRSEQRLATAALKACEAIAKKYGLDLTDVHEQIVSEARRRGVIIPMPGKHY